MIVPIIRVEVHFNRLIKDIRIMVEDYTPPRMPNPTEQELGKCPASFRCFACLRRKGKKRHFGGYILGQRVCQECYPYVDEGEVGAMIRFDQWHGFRVE